MPSEMSSESPTGPTPDPSTPEFTWHEYDDPGEDQRWSTWGSVEPLCRGPQPWPDWLVTSAGAIDTELGVLKTGKEADVHLIERADPADPGSGVVLAAKRYRGAEHRSFHRNSDYTAGRTVRNSRDMRAMARKSDFGKQVAAGQWAVAEWGALIRLWELGIAVPYPVQIDGTEILMEWIRVGVASAPRLAQTRPTSALLMNYWDQVLATLSALAAAGLVHGDMSPYNILAAGDRLVFIDVPQLVDLVANPNGVDFLNRDCRNMVTWFNARGLSLEFDEVFALVLAAAW